MEKYGDEELSDNPMINFINLAIQQCPDTDEANHQKKKDTIKINQQTRIDLKRHEINKNKEQLALEGKRTCIRCFKTKDINEFKNANQSCVICLEKSHKSHKENPERTKAQVHKYYNENKEDIRAQHKKYKEENKEHLKEKKKEYMKIIYTCPVCNYDIKKYKKITT